MVNDLKSSLDCPRELAVGKPAIAIVDKDDFKSDTVTGAGQSCLYSQNHLIQKFHHMTMKIASSWCQLCIKSLNDYQRAGR